VAFCHLKQLRFWKATFHGDSDQWKHQTNKNTKTTAVKKTTVKETPVKNNILNNTVVKSQGSDRINCRISPTIKRQAEAAAHALGQSITAFTETALAEKAQSVLAEQERIAMSERDFARFVEIVNDNTPPAPALVKAMRAYEKTKAAHPDRGL
jgi:uncharacterized protein (DUF1778 family)